MNETTSLLGRRRGIRCNINSEEEIMNSSIFHEIQVEKEMRRKLNDFFMSTWQKWRLRGQFPWKICIQAMLFTIFSFQLYSFGNHRTFHLEQHSDMTAAFNKVFLKDWHPDTSVYPSINKADKIYTVPDFYHHVDYTVNQYAKLNSERIGSYGYDSENGKPPPLKFCFQQYDGEILPENVFIEIGSVQEHCFLIPVHDLKKNHNLDSFSFEKFLKHSNYSLNFGTLIQAQLTFRLKMVFRKFMSKMDPPECYRLNLGVEFDNTKHAGLISVSLNIRPIRINCNVKSNIANEDFQFLLRQNIDTTIALLCVASIILCSISLGEGFKLLKETVYFFKHYQGKSLTPSESLDFIDFWYVTIILSEIIILYGLYVKIQVQEINEEITNFSTSAEILGYGYIVQIVGNFRYVSYNLKSNVLLLIIKKSFLNIIRCLACILVLFWGYCVIGWIVLAPYHVKFSSLSAASESIFSAMQGDDIFGIFTSLNTDRLSVWWFCQIYTYSFIIIYIYVFGTLIITFIGDAFEILKQKYVNDDIPSTSVEIFLEKEEYLAFYCKDSEPAPSSKDKVKFWNALKMLKEIILS
ncbi:Mucolipin-3 [Araneus ventricosus]|uniref:Mucolipin-3 n=1 Tax=Araneus ventricosus TaxID=182803 RepID=A0A4Y2TM57_ARAVE|nr:Mucolipin-3 [Araneus ventricosus]